ncbi:Tm-1-like ATP-binding domain-containing protein, partial [Cribrihabitans sp. XS_ASV171]
ATAPVAVFLPLEGCNEWDRAGADLHDAEGLAAFCAEMETSCPANADLHKLDAHINDDAFCEAVLTLFDLWVEQGIVKS